MDGKSSFDHAIDFPEFVNRKKAEKYRGGKSDDFKGTPVWRDPVAGKSARHWNDIHQIKIRVILA
jgi:hypothetical protein